MHVQHVLCWTVQVHTTDCRTLAVSVTPGSKGFQFSHDLEYIWVYRWLMNQFISYAFGWDFGNSAGGKRKQKKENIHQP